AAARSREARRHRRSHPHGRRRDREVSQDGLRVLRAIIGRGADVRGDRARPEARAALRAWLDGEYGMSGLFLGVPCKLGRGGIEQILQVELTGDERAALAKSADAVREPMKVVGL